MDGVISVIIPVYNVELYLAQCIESVLSQDYKKLEVILIDDGSTDRSGTICDEYAVQDDRIVVIHQKNGGAAAAKNAGLRLATGEYLSFVDSDDYLEPNVYGYMLKVLKEQSADVVQFSFQEQYIGHTEPRLLQTCVMDEKEYLLRFNNDWTCALLWNKLYRRSLFEDIFFEEGHKIDDEFFTYQGILNSCKIFLDDKIIYNYRMRASGVMRSPESQQRIVYDSIDFIAKRRKKVVQQFPQLRKKFDRDFTYAMVDQSRRSCNTVESITLIKRYLKEYLKEVGHTPISIFQLYDIFHLLFTKAEKLLVEIKKEQPDIPLGMLFD